MNKVILGDQSPWNGGLLRAKALRKAGIDFTYQHHDADVLGVLAGGPTGVCRGNPPYFSLACRLPMSLAETSTVEQQAVLNACKGSVKPVVYMQYNGNKTIWGGELEIRDKTEEMFTLERIHLSAVSGNDVLPKARCISGAIKLHSDGIQVSSIVEMFHESPPYLTNHLDPEHFWGIDYDRNRKPYSRDLNWYAIVPRGPALILEFASRGLTLGFGNCAYQAEVIRLRNTRLRGAKIKIKALKIKFHWDTDFLGENTRVGQAWRKKGQPDFSSITNYWATHPTSMGVLAFGGNVNHTFEEHEW